LATDADVVVAGAGIDPTAIAARIVVEVLNAAIAEHGQARWVLAGGGTPSALYQRLATRHAEALDWSRVAFYWGDERCVPPGDPESNFGRAEAALLRPLGASPSAVHRIAGELGARAAAAGYDATVDEVLAEGAWDLVLLGLGADGHTASLFEPPATAGVVVAAAAPWAMAAFSPLAPRERVTLTVPALSRSRRVLFLVTGAAEAAAVARALGGDRLLPATHVRPVGDGRLTWCLDRPAAALVEGRGDGG
jgi:6-phosphogluconolactonase